MVGDNEIADIVSDWTRIPVRKLAEEESERLLKLESILHERVVGQEEAVTAVSKAIRRGRVGLKDRSAAEHGGAVDVYLDEQLHHGSGSAVYPLRLADG